MASVAVASANEPSAASQQLGGIAALWLASVIAPAALLVWMPIVLGVPHVANDVRFLVLPLPRLQAAAAVVACSALVALRAVTIATGAHLLPAEIAVVAVWLIATLCLAPTTRWRLALAAAAVAVMVAAPLAVAAVAALAHNFVAVIAWLVVARPGRRHAIAIVALLAGAVALALLVGPTIAAHTGGQATRWLTLDRAAATLFPGMRSGRALIVAFTFLQAVHYTIWLSWIPRSRGRARAQRSWVIAAASLVVIGAGLIDATWARTTYLALATFHIYLELVVLIARLAMRRSR